MSQVADPILLVEDDEAQATLVVRVLARARLDNRVVVAGTVRDAIAYLAEVDGDGRAGRRPVLILLDMRLPDGSGTEVLGWVRRHAELADVPVIALSASNDAEDITRAFALGATTYLVKPVAFDAVIDAVNDLGLRWALLPASVDHA